MSALSSMSTMRFVQTLNIRFGPYRRNWERERGRERGRVKKGEIDREWDRKIPGCAWVENVLVVLWQAQCLLSTGRVGCLKCLSSGPWSLGAQTTWRLYVFPYLGAIPSPSQSVERLSCACAAPPSQAAPPRQAFGWLGVALHSQEWCRPGEGPGRVSLGQELSCACLYFTLVWTFD